MNELKNQLNKIDIKKAGLIGFGVALVYYVLLFNSGDAIDQQIVQVQQEIAQNQAKLNSIQTAISDQKRFEAELQEINTNMKDFQTYFGPDMSNNELQSKVSNYAEESGIIVNQMAPGKATDEFPTYQETVVAFEVEGTFHQVMGFVSRLTHMNRAMDFSEMKFETVTGGDFPIIKLTTTLVVYSNKDQGGTDAAG